MKGRTNVYAYDAREAKGDISFTGDKGQKALFTKFISKRNDIDPDGALDVIAHGNSMVIEIANGNDLMQINARAAAKLIKKIPGFISKKSVRLFSCSTGALQNGFAQHLANALGKPVFAPNMTLHANAFGRYWVSDNGKIGTFVKFVPGGYKNGK